MPLVLENFMPGDPGNTLNQHHARDAYRRLSAKLNAAQAALVRIAHDPIEQNRFTRWFGPYLPATKRVVERKIRAIQHAIVNQRITFRNGGSECRLNTYAYVRPYTGLFKVYLCGLFFRSGRVGADSAMGTIVHEVSHVKAGTQDHEYGQADCLALAVNQSAQARNNADNYQYYCESF